MFKELVDQIINAIIIKVLNVVLSRIQSGDLDAFIGAKVNELVDEMVA